MGHRAIVWSGAPEVLGYRHFADPYWDPLWAAVQDLDTVVALHIGGAGGASTPLWPGYAPMRRLAAVSAQAITSNAQIMGNLLFSGVLERFPRLKFISIESGLGWIPHLLEVADHQYNQQRLRQHGMNIKPSELFHRQCYANFWFEQAGVAMRHLIGVDNILWESDFPHPTATYPNSREFIERGLAGVPEAEKRKMLVENALKLYHLD
jgi:predicted TIM-barrel fold metal-dependent hydrolase